ncbi:DUF4189 domain-containing protein [Acinetobacter sp. 1000160]|uniref:DUF4189 domain-containing protein n=1 Tax=Acinetobacter sp. 1000160 TaxID=1310800 RepID=UPI001D17AFCB|nr:DUF4189 domain-containing protein [Acinetobacter sp. 1000160]
MGAIASDRIAIFGIVSNKASKKEAKSSAIQECINRGGAKSKCEITLIYYNQCAAVVAGLNGTISSHAPSVENAVQQAMNKCNAEKGGQCRVYYSGCSYPEQIQ